jgi:N-glycosylase/DNA lyase
MSNARLENRRRMENTVKVLCPIIEKRIQAKNNASSEYGLRRELVACILGSQVRHEMAVTALAHLENDCLLDDKWWKGVSDRFENRVFNVLVGKTSNTHWHYRFPKIKANQLARTRDALAARSLTERLSDAPDPWELRHYLIADIHGIGPKQASMFLRNIGMSYEFAILDTHVLRFLYLQDLLRQKAPKLGTISAYEKIEQIVIRFAKKIGFPAGYLDWAIWVTMRAARELGI